MTPVAGLTRSPAVPEPSGSPGPGLSAAPVSEVVSGRPLPAAAAGTAVARSAGSATAQTAAVVSRVVKGSGSSGAPGLGAA